MKKKKTIIEMLLFINYDLEPDLDGTISEK